jgi:hypothetical protein
VPDAADPVDSAYRLELFTGNRLVAAVLDFERYAGHV